MKRIVVGVDGSPASKAALAWAVEEARVHGASVEPVLAWEFPPSTEYFVPTQADLEGAAIAELQKLVADLDASGLEVEPATVEASPAVALLHAAEGADLLVVGSHGHGAFVGMMLGSVSLRVVTHAPCPVVVVPFPGE